MTSQLQHTRLCVIAIGALVALGCGDVENEDRPTGAIRHALAPAGSGSEYVSDTVPRSLYPGERRRAAIVLKNTGASSPQNDWTVANPAYVLTSNWDDRDTGVADVVAVGSTSAFSFVVTAPTVSGTFSARMSVQGLGAFGVGLQWPVEISPSVTPSWSCTFVEESSTIPLSLAPGESRAISIVVRNTGSETWPADALRLTSMDTPASRWGQTVSGPVAVDVAPGAQLAFPLVIKAPTTPGTYTFFREMKDYRLDGVGAFRRSDYCVSRSINVEGNPPLDATVIAQNFPAVMAPGETKSVTVTMKNTGLLPWKSDGTFRLNSISVPVSLWGVTMRNVESDVLPNGQATFALSVTAPTTPGVYHHLWQMRETQGENPGPFGARIDVPVEIVAGSLPEFGARVVSQEIPRRMNGWHPYVFSITMQNTGTASWSGNNVWLDSTNVPSSLWGRTIVPLAAGETVAPGQSKRFDVNVRAPLLTPDSIPVEVSSSWRMRASTLGRFGDTASTTGILVFGYDVPSFAAATVSNTLPAEMVSGQTYPVTITLRNTGMEDWSGSGFQLVPTTAPPGGWGISGIPLAADETVGPNQTHTFSFSIAAATGYTGALTSRWRMQNQGQLFGAELEVAVSVGSACPAGVERNACGGCSVLTTPPDNSPCGSCGHRVCGSDGDSVVCEDPGFDTPVQVTTGNRFSCLRLASGGVRCWGDNSYGQLGDDSFFVSRRVPSAPSLPGFSYVKAAVYHVCGITTEQTMKCWGMGGNGQIGDGTTFNHRTPTAVPGLNGVTQISVGYDFSCARVGTSAVYCWGANTLGQLGDGTTTKRASRSDAYPALLPQPVTFFASSSRHSCAIANGEVYCWGSNTYGALGSGNPGTPGVPQYTAIPAHVDGLSGVTSLAAGDSYTCALTEDGSVYCWGITCTFNVVGNTQCLSGVGGELANGSISKPTKMIGLAKPAKALSVGGWMVCAVLVDDTVQCWGANFRGELGLGDNVDRFLPVTVPNLTGVQSIDDREATTCAVYGGGSLACWGANQSGQVGDGTLVERWSPTAVAGASTICEAP